ncbi:MAG: cytochrome c oxidase subunit [Bryobacterales bacterium]|jgi:heme/copper-type cytochrome/quinol oxidase subunit 3|nr:cytochrome c oxidase subunit [Bryobacterales bacterium]
MMYLETYLETRQRRLTALFIVANLAFFATLLAVMFYLRSVSVEWPTPFHFASLLMVSALTMFSLCASVTAAIGAHAARIEPTTEPAVRWIAIAISCWFVFLFLEIVEWVRLVYMERLGPHTLFGGTYLMLTCTHWVAATGCLGWFCYVAADVKKRDILAAALYSHFLNVWWIILVITVYFFNADIQGI